MEEFMNYLSEAEAAGQADLSGFSVIIITSIIFGLMLKVLYGLYFRDNEPQDSSLSRSLVIMTPALTTIFWMIQSSLILSIGLMGSMSVIRFRTPIKRPEDIAFIVIAVAIAIAIAVRATPIAAMLIGLIFIYTMLKNYSPLGVSKVKFAVITFNTKKEVNTNDVLGRLGKLRIQGEFVSSRTYDGITSYVFNASKVTKSAHDVIKQCFLGLDNEAHINIFYPNEHLGV